MAAQFYIMQDAGSSDVTIACRLVTDDDSQVTLVPGQWVQVASCDPGTHILRVGAILGAGTKDVVLSLQGGTYHGNNKIEEKFFSPTDGGSYDIEVQS